MGYLSNIRAKLQALKLGFIPLMGTARLPTGQEDYPAFLANEGAGGAHGYESLEDLADANPNLLHPPMLALVKAHTRPDGTAHPATIYQLLHKPEQRLSEIPYYNLSLYWQVYHPEKAQQSQELEMRYAPNVDARSGEADPNGGRPIFPGGSGRVITQAEYNQLWKGNTLMLASENLATGTQTAVPGYWEAELDGSRHFWFSQRVAGTENWSAPISFGSESIEQNDFTATLYQWATHVPAQPARYVNGQLNNNPEGWFDTIPGQRPSEQHKLYATKAKKNAVFQLKSDWFPPYEIPLDPARVRYSEKRTPDPNEINNGVFDEAQFSELGWEATPRTEHKYIATRLTISSSWFVEQMAQESGAYTDTVYRNVDLSLLDQILNPVTARLHRPKGKTPAGWTDTPDLASPSQITIQSSAQKYVTGELISDWGNPIPANGVDSFVDVIRTDGGSEFHTGKDGITSPPQLLLTAELYRGTHLIRPLDISYSWKKIFDNGQVLDEDLFYNQAALVVEASDVTGLAIYECTQTYQNLIFRSEFTVQDISDGIDAKVLQIRGNSPLLLRNNDGTYQPAEITLRAFSQNLTDENTLQWRKNGVLLTDVTGPILAVDYLDFTSQDEITYRVESADGLHDEFTVTKTNQGTGIDAITMVLDNEAQTLVLDAATNKTNFQLAKSRVQVFNGLTDETGAWFEFLTKQDTNVTSELTWANGVALIQVLNMAAGAVSGSVKVSGTRNGKTLTKVFSLARITDPVGATFAVIRSNKNGFVFAPNALEDKVLSAELLVSNNPVPVDQLRFEWYLNNAPTVNATTASIVVSRAMVSFSYPVRCVITYQNRKFADQEILTDVRDAARKGALYTVQEVDNLGNPISSNDVPPNSVAYHETAYSSPEGVNWSASRAGAIFETIRDEYAAGWSGPVRIAGEKGSPGLNGTTTRMAKVYRWVHVSEVPPPIAVQNLSPPDWSTQPPAQPSLDFTLWVSVADVTVEDAPKLLPPGWSAPFPFNGARGPQGNPGQAATIQPGNVTLLEPGSAPYVSNRGNQVNAIFDFYIPAARDGQFNADRDFWDGNAWILEGSTGGSTYPRYSSYSIKFRKTKTGVVHYMIRFFSNGDTGWLNHGFPNDLREKFRPMSGAAGSGSPVKQSLMGSYFQGARVSAGFSNAELAHIYEDANGLWVTLYYKNTWTYVAQGSYLAASAF